jgi:hypothetical protein
MRASPGMWTISIIVDKSRFACYDRGDSHGGV